MTTPAYGQQIAVSDAQVEVGRGYNWQADLNFLNGYIKPTQRDVSPMLNTFHDKAYYVKSNDGNCNNGNTGNCNCNCGNIQCYATANCENINCVNCDGQNWLQSNCNCACTYNCNSNQNCYSYNCNCSKIICTKLFSLGRLPVDVFMADQQFGDYLIKNHPDVYNGYAAWAQIVVDWMSNEGPMINFWVRDEKQRRQELTAWARRWAEEIATPWAEWMAHKMGVKAETNYTGLVLMAIGAPISKAVGVWQRVFGKSQKKTSMLTGFALVAVFAMLMGVVKVGKLFGKIKNWSFA